MDGEEINEDISYKANVPLRNLYKPLEKESTEENNSQNQEKQKEERIPPIIMPSEGLDYKLPLTELKKIAGIDQFKIQYLKKNVKIFAKDTSVYEKLKNELRKAQTPFFTYTRKQEKVKKIVFKGPPNLEIPAIMRELREAQCEPTECIQLRTRSNRPSHSYLVTIPNRVQYKQLRQTKTWSMQ